MEIRNGEVVRNELTENAMGGTELMTLKLHEHLGKKLKGFQIIASRVRELDDKLVRILICHDLPGDPESNHLANGGWQKFHKIVFVSHWQQQRYLEKYSIPWSSTVVMKNAVDPIEVDLNAKFESAKDGKVRFIYHTTPHRGLNILVPTFAKLTEQFPNVHLDVFSSFGLYGWEERDKEFDGLFKEIDDHPNMTRHKSVSNEEVRKWVANAHVFPYPSTWPETSCQMAGARIMTKGGIKTIENIVKGDEVLTHTGRFKKVTDTFVRPYKGKIIGLSVRGVPHKVYFTDDHKLFVGDVHKNSFATGKTKYTRKIYGRTWVSAKDIDTNKQCLLSPKLNGRPDSIVRVNMLDYMVGSNTYEEVSNGHVVHVKNCSHYKTRPNNLEITEKAAEMMGLFAGDGCAPTTYGRKQSTITFANHSTDENNMALVEEFFGEQGVECKRINKGDNQTDVVLNSAIWSRFLRGAIGVGKSKKVPDFIWDSTLSVQKAFIDGYFAADGSLDKSRNRKRLQTISVHLAYGLLHLLQSQGVHPSVNYNSDRQVYEVQWKDNPDHKTWFEDDQYFGKQITDRSAIEYCGLVYNFEVEGDHSYVTDGISAHNCLSLMEAMSAGCMCIHSNFGALYETSSNWTHMYGYQDDLNEHAGYFYNMLTHGMYCIESMAEDEGILIKLKGQKSFADLFYNWETRAREWEALLDSMRGLPTEIHEEGEVFSYNVG